MAQLSALHSLVSNALEVVEIKLIREPEDVDDDAEMFHPTYAHQVFGENESIFGYRDLKVRLYYTAGALNIFMGIKYSQRVDDFNGEGLKADDVSAKVSDLLTSGCYYTHIDEFLGKLKKEDQFQPLGEQVDHFEVESDEGEKRVFEFYKCETTTPGFVEFHTRLQTFMMWFVDAASYIDIDDPQWTFLICYEKYKTSDGNTHYATVGYTTIYVYYAYPENIRPRISQMLVLPPFQRMGIGSKFIEVVYKQFQSDPKVVDLTVEDPSDDFKRIRNLIDAKLCQTLASFAPDKLKLGFSPEMVAETKSKFKINSKQARVIYEILRLQHTDENNAKEYQAYRLDIKKRLNLTYHKQKSEMKKLEKSGVDPQWISASLATVDERIEQLKTEYQAVEEEYRQILEKLED